MRVGLDSLGTRMNAGFPLMVPGAGLEPARLAAGDFESPASTNFTTRADCEVVDYDIFLSGFEGGKVIFKVPITRANIGKCWNL